MDFQEFIKPELLIIVPALYLIGAGIRKSEIANKHIPWILGLVSVILAGLYIFASEPQTSSQAVATALFTAITQGILCAGASVYVDQLIKQTKKED